MIKFDNEAFRELDENGVLDYIANNGAVIPYVSPFNDYYVFNLDKMEQVNMSQENARRLYIVLQDYIKNHKKYCSAIF